MNRQPPRVVFDCVIYAQALLNPAGPSGACVKAAESGACILHIAEFVLREIRELTAKVSRKEAVAAPRIAEFIEHLKQFARVIDEIPEVFVHPKDPKDSAYVNLAIATRSELIVSRDTHLLNLTNASKSDWREFRKRFPLLRIMRPVEFLNQLRSQNLIE